MPSVVVLLQHGTKARDSVDPRLTQEGREQASRAAQALAPARPERLVSSPLIRAQESIRPLSIQTGLPVEIDDRVRERMEFNPDEWSSRPQFLTAWDRATQGRDYTPPTGDSARTAAARMARAVVDHASVAGFVVIATHGGVTVDLVRGLSDHGTLDPRLLHEGMPNGHLTTLWVSGDVVKVLGIGIEPGSWTMPQSD